MKICTTVFTLLLLATILTAQNDVCQITLPSTRVAAYAHGEQVEIDFEYSIDEAGGARIFVRPFSNGSLSPGYSASGSPLYSGDGTGSSMFTIGGGEVMVDEIRFLITNADQTATLREFYIPVKYFFSTNGVHNFQFSAEQEVTSFLLGEQVFIDFDYLINQPGGVRVFIRPFTNGALTPGYSATGSAAYTGSGSETANFSITAGTNVRVDELRVNITNEDQSETLQTFFIPVNWYWSTVKVDNISILQNNFAANGEDRTVSFDYETTESEGVRIFPRPITNGETTPDYGACGSSIYTGNGSTNCNFTINSGNQRVDHIRFRATTADQSEVLLEILQPTDLFFGNVLIENLVTCPPSPARLLHGERVNGYFDYTNNMGETGRFFFRPATAGSLSPGYGASGSPAFPAGSGSSDAYFTINSGHTIVDQIHFLLDNNDQTVDWGTLRFDVHYEYGDGFVSSVASTIAPEYFNWQVAPNPVREQAVVQLLSEKPATVSIRLLDIQGRSLAQWNGLELLPGSVFRHELPVESLNLSGGLYLVQVQGSEFLLTKKLVIER